MGYLIGAALALLMAAIAASDWRSYRVPDRLTLLALILRAADLARSADPSVLDIVLRALAMAGLFYLFRLAYRALRGREGLGLGDVKLAAVAGAWVDWPLLPYVVEAAALFGLGLALWRARGRARADMRLPFAVGFAPAIFVGWQIQILAL